MDIRRTFLWVVFAMSVILLWDNWMRYNGKPSLFFPSTTQTQQATPAAGAGSTAQSGLPQAGQAAVQAVPGTPASGAVPGGESVAKSERITLTTDLIKAQINTLGGELTHLELLQHKESVHRAWYAAFTGLFGASEKVEPARNVTLFDESRHYLAQTGLIGGPFPNHKSVFVARPGARALDGGNQVQLVLEAEQSGVKLVKTYTFTRGSYVIDIKHEVINASGAPITPTAYLQLVRDNSKLPGESMFYSTFTGPAVYTDAEKFRKINFDDIEKGKAPKAATASDGWVSMVQHYFVSAFLPQDKAPREIYTDKVAPNLYSVGTKLPLGTIAPGATAATDARLYAGPQESARLEKFAPGFDLVKDYGWLTVVAKPIFWLMTQIHNVIGNWGWTIIALTVLIKLVFFPLTAASYRSMAKMKSVTPKMTAIRERHKGDPQKMNQAMMELYKTEKINPLGGCLPILIQMPVFIALYWVLLASVEMRNAPWIGWIHDLASPDPFYILPVIMAASMFIQTKLNPTPPDPMQAKMMMWMPIIFSVMFFFFPAGLVLYWVVNNVLSIAQQWLINKKMKA
ncbi:membrane protein insertase YidC [Noviherbaspirillum sedimenti]|uniref:Membrane protein insertase YidC n=1 Tax=Noviherbaspirillum sedimenti TaxID=2320865 RepID=A0A3A3GL23_9BURK|nr:membrane protein insertase YidC [Noviherbaspirillum sedimenti]RJG02966.1 membrane protein insertase YidC [Noviherbaspirillum sedimenti]